MTKIMRVGGTDGQSARGLKTDVDGNLGVHLRGNNGSINFVEMSSDFVGKIVGQDNNPHRAMHRNYYHILSLDEIISVHGDFKQEWYNLIMYHDNNPIKLSTSGSGEGQYKHVVFEFNILGEVNNKVDFNGTILDLKNDIKDINVRFFGDGYGVIPEGGVSRDVALKAWNSTMSDWNSLGVTSDFVGINGKLNIHHINDDGKIYILAHNVYPSGSTANGEVATDYINIDFLFKERKLNVELKNSTNQPVFTKKTQDIYSMLGSRTGKSKETILSDANHKFNLTPAILYTRSKKMIVVWREGNLHVQDKDSTVKMKISGDFGESFKEVKVPFDKVNEDQRDFFLFQEGRIGRIFLGGFNYVFEGSEPTLKPLLYKSDNDGESWDEIDIDAQLGGAYAPLSRRMIQDSNGDLYLFSYTDKSSPRKITMTKSTDTGITWSPLKTIVTPEMINGSGLTEAAMEFIPSKQRIIGVLRLDDGKNSAVVYSDDFGENWDVLNPNIGFQSHGADLLLGDNESLILFHRNGGREPNIKVSYDGGYTWSKSLITFGYRNGGYGQMALIAPNLYAVVYDYGFADTVSDIFMNFVSIPYVNDQKTKVLKTWEKDNRLVNFQYMDYGEDYRTSAAGVTPVDVSRTSKRMIVITNNYDTPIKVDINAYMVAGEVLYKVNDGRITINAGEKEVITDIDFPLLNEPYQGIAVRLLRNDLNTPPTTGDASIRFFGE